MTAITASGSLGLYTGHRGQCRREGPRTLTGSPLSEPATCLLVGVVVDADMPDAGRDRRAPTAHLQRVGGDELVDWSRRRISEVNLDGDRRRGSHSGESPENQA